MRKVIKIILIAVSFLIVVGIGGYLKDEMGQGLIRYFNQKL